MSRPGAPRVPGRPLAGRRIAVTRPRAQAGELTAALEALGAEVVAAPAIRITPLADLAPLRTALAHLSRYAWVVFTSPNTVRVVCDHLPGWGLAAADLRRVPVAAIGPGTAAALAHYGLAPDLVPEEFVAEAVVRALAARGDVTGQWVLLPRAREARDTLPAGLARCGALVDVIPVYETVPEATDGAGLAHAIAAGTIDAITFTSSSTVRHFVELVGREAATSGRFVAAVIGPVTARTAHELGIAVAVEAEEYSVPGLVAALTRYFGGERSPASEDA